MRLSFGSWVRFDRKLSLEVVEGSSLGMVYAAESPSSVG